MQVRAACFLLWSLFSPLAKTKPVSYWSRQRLIVSEKPSGLLHENYSITYVINQILSQTFPFSSNIISFVICWKQWKQIPLFQVQILFHAYQSFRSSPQWIARMRGRLWDFPNQAFVDLYCENLSWKLKRFIFIYLHFSFLKLQMVLLGYSEGSAEHNFTVCLKQKV